ncbi:hypothetical protein Trydic_g20575 [Trypoxylus dichotomus]
MMQLQLLLFLAVVFRSHAGNPFDPIINGVPTKISEFPYYAALSSDGKGVRCGGAIIKSNIILTAAHCLFDANFSVYTGIQNLDDLKNERPCSVKKVIAYPRYHDETKYDIGLVILSDYIQLGATAKIIPLTRFNPGIGSNVTIVGMGRFICDPLNVDDSGRCIGGRSMILRSATARLTKNYNGVIKTVNDNQNTCYGDSGGPVVYRNRVIGVVSSGEYDNCAGYDTHTSAMRYYFWIKRYMRKYY